MAPEWETLASGYQLAEAPRADGDGSVWFTDALGGGVYRWRDGDVETVVPKRRGVGGLALHARGGIVVSGRDVTHVEADGTNRLLFAPPEGVTGFNDIAAAPDGSVVAGGLRFLPFAGDAPVPGSFFRIIAAEEGEEVVGDIEWPNGVGHSPDGETLYVCDYSRGQVVARDAAGQRVLLTTPGGEADGLAVDREGGVWVALGGRAAIGRFTPEGELDVELSVPATFVTSLGFGGDDGCELYVTTAARGDDVGALLRTEAPVPGAPLHRATI